MNKLGRLIMKEKFSLRKLFTSTFYLSAFTFGGGYIIVSLMKRKFVDELGWLNEDEMLDLTAIAQSAPGPIAVNGAIVLGYKLAGVIGVFVATLATVLPPFLIISMISLCYEWFNSNQIVALMLKGMQAGVSALILTVSVQMIQGLIKSNEIFLIVLLCLAFIASFVFNINVTILILITIIIALVVVFTQRK